MTDDDKNDGPGPAPEDVEDVEDGKDGKGGRGAGRKHNVQPKPEDQRGRPDPKERKDFPRQNIPNS